MDTCSTNGTNGNQGIDNEMKRIRDVLFPAIGIQIITGFNLYLTPETNDEQQPTECGEVVISYLHEDLLEEKLHYLQIKQMLDKYSDQIKVQRIKHEAITRFSSYRLEEGWRTEEYYLVDQTPVKTEDVNNLVRQNITVIGCGPQNELIIRCEKDALEYILEQFRLHVNQYEIDQDTGRFVLIDGDIERKENKQTVWDNSWEIPVIIVHADGVDNIKTYERIRRIGFRTSTTSVVSMMVGNKWDTTYETDTPKKLIIPSLEQFLVLNSFNPIEVDDTYFANKIFVDWINEINWRRVAKTVELYSHLFKL